MKCLVLSASVCLITFIGSVGASAQLSGGTQVNARMANARNAALKFTLQSATRNLLDNPALLDVRSAPLEIALTKLTSQSGVPVVYSPSLLSKSLVSCACRGATVGEALDRLLANTEFGYVEAAGQILIELHPDGATEVMVPIPAMYKVPIPAMHKVEVNRTSRPLSRAVSAPSEARVGTITGTVRDASTLQPIVSAQVVLPGLGRGTLTRGDGRYLLVDIPDGTHTIEVSSIGYDRASQDVTVTTNAQAAVDFTLRSAAISLDAVVVTGAGVQEERRRLGFASAAVGAAEIASRPIQSVTQTLRGQIAGVMPMNSLGQTGSGARIRLRGQSSLTQRGDPLIFIDGIRQDGTVSGLGHMITSRLDDINPADIERIEVIKGASAATLFGTEASAGVIQIFTKQGAAGPTQYSFSIEQGLSRIPLDRVRESKAYDYETKKFVTHADLPHLNEGPLRTYLKTGHLQNYNLSASGGTSDLTYFVSGRFMRDKGAPPNSMAENMSLRANIDMSHGSKLRTELGVNIVRNRIRKPTQSGSQDIMAIHTHSNPLFADVEGGRPYGEGLLSVQDVLGGEYWQFADRYAADLRTSYQWSPSLRSQLVVGFNRVTESEEITVELGDAGVAAENTLGRRRIDTAQRRFLTVDGNTTWESQVTDQIGIQLWGGGQAFFEDRELLRMESRDFPAPGLTTVDAGASIVGFNEDRQRVVNAGLFSQAQLAFRDRMFVTVGVRADGNSAFGENISDLTFYPKVGGSYVLSDEPFWPGGEILSLFRLRTAYGQSGLQPGAFEAQQTWNPRNRLGTAVVWPGNLGNPDLKPERTTELEMGVDLSAFNDRFGVELTYYKKRTTDAIVPVRLPASMGFQTPQSQNVGEIEASGIEALVNWNVVQRPSWGWSLTGSAGTVDQKVTSLGEGVDEYQQSVFRVQNFVKVGYPPGVYGSNFLDEDNPYTLSVPIEEFNHPSQLTANSVKNAAGQDSLIYHHAGVPTFTGSIGSDLRLPGNLSLNALFTGATGFSVFDQATLLWYTRGAGHLQGSSSRAEHLAELDDPATTPERRRELAEFEARVSDTIWGNWVVDGDYFRFQELSLAYRVPSSLVSRLGFQDLTVSLAAQNLYLWVKSDRILADPGPASNQQTSSIINTNMRFHLPSPRTFTLSFQGRW